MVVSQEPPPSQSTEPTVNKKCAHYLQAKRRSCKMDAVPGELYCGNHLYLYKPKSGQVEGSDDGEGGWRARKRKERIPCPADPNHTVAKCDLQAHLARCPAAVEAAARQAVKYYVPDVNAGDDEEPDLPAAAAGVQDSSALAAAGQSAAAQQPASTEVKAQQAAMRSPFVKGRAALRTAAAQALGEQGWTELVSKLEATFERECGGEPPLIELRPPECEPGLVPGATHNGAKGAGGSIRPFDEKHALQQASIVGHMLRSGVLPLRPRPCVGGEEGVLVELGAGKAGLSGMAIIEPEARRACNIGGAVLVDNRASFQAKADRFMREIQLARVKMDLKDFQVKNAPLLLTDPPAGAQGSPQQEQDVQQQGYRSWACCAKHLCGAATDFGLRACLNRQQQDQSTPGGSSGPDQQGADVWHAWQGLAIATCCHHRCGWRSYVGKHVWQSWGLTALEFEVACAITGWALCGHDAPQGCTGLSNADEDQSAGRCSDDEGCEPPDSQQGGQADNNADITVWPYLTRSQRMALGLKCKTIIDWGRAVYAAQQLGLQWTPGLTAKQGSVGGEGTGEAGAVQFVRYIRPEVSGENRLLIVKPGAAQC